METNSVIKNKGIYVSLLLFFSISLFPQERPPMYLMFKENSKELCDVHPDQRGRFHVVKNILKYAKVESKEGDVIFYICNEKLIHEKSKMEKRIVCSNFLDDKKLLDYKDLAIFLNDVQDKYPMGYIYPSDEYPKIYITITLSDSKICLYEVKWQYYIE